MALNFSKRFNNIVPDSFKTYVDDSIINKVDKPNQQISGRIPLVDITGDDIEYSDPSSIQAGYLPTLNFNAVSIPNQDISDTFQLSFAGTFMDAVTNITLSASTNNSGINVTKVSSATTYTNLVVETTTNSVEQEYALIFNGIKTNDIVTLNFNSQAVVNNIFIPSLSGTSERLWQTNSDPNNLAILTDGGFESPEGLGSGFDDYGYYGNFTANEIRHRFTIGNVTPVINTGHTVLASMRFTDDISVGNTGIRFYFYNSGGSNFCRFHHLNGVLSLGALTQNDDWEVRLTSSSVSIYRNNLHIITNTTEDFSTCMTNAYVTLSAYRTLELINIESEIIS